jgi:hypothetical protein
MTVIDPVLFVENITGNSSYVDMLESYAVLQVNSNNSLVLKLDIVHVHLANIVPDYLNLNFEVDGWEKQDNLRGPVVLLN